MAKVEKLEAIKRATCSACGGRRQRRTIRENKPCTRCGHVEGEKEPCERCARNWLRGKVTEGEIFVELRGNSDYEREVKMISKLLGLAEISFDRDTGYCFVYRVVKKAAGKCSKCGGSGWEPLGRRNPRECSRCSGSGKEAT